MNKRIFFLLTICFFLLTLPLLLPAQVGINDSNADPDPSAMLDVESSDKGLLLPRMTTAQRNAISSPATGLMIYNLDDSCFNYFLGEKWIKDCGTVNGEEPSLLAVFGHTGHEYGYGIGTDDNGNLYITGSFDEFTKFGNITLSTSELGGFLLKIDPVGQVLWAIQTGYTGRDLVVDASGNSYVTGRFEGSASFGSTSLSSNGIYDVFVAKIDPSGNPVWAVSAGGSNSDLAYGISVDPAGNSYITGYFVGTATFGTTTLTSNGSADIFVAKIDPSGQILWAKNFGGSGWDMGEDTYFDANGNSYITGKFSGSVSFGSTTLNGGGGFAVKLDPLGQAVWAVKVGASGTDISLDASNNSYVTGYFGGTSSFGDPANPDTTLTSNGEDDIFVAKVDPSGQLLWAMQAGNTQDDRGYGITLDVAGNSYITGYFEGTVSFGSTTLTSLGGYEIFVLKIDPNGIISWAVNAGSDVDDSGYGITLDNSGQVFLTGYFNAPYTPYPAYFGNIAINGFDRDDIFVWSLDGGSGAPIKSSFSLSELQDGDTDPGNELQTLSLSSNQLSLSNGGSVDLSSLLNDTDEQQLSLSNDQLSLTDGGSVDLSPYLDDTDDQQLSLSTDQLSLTNGGSVDLTPYLDNTDSQNLGLAGTNLTITGGTGVDLSSLVSLGDNLGDHISTQNIQLGNYFLSGDGDNEGLSVSAVGRIGVGTQSQASLMHLWHNSEGDTTGIKLTANNGATNSLMYLEDGDLILRKKNQTDQLVLNVDGFVGIGTNEPNQALSVNGNIEVNSEDPDLIFRDETGGENRRSIIRTSFVPGGNTSQQEMQFYVSSNANDGARMGMKITGEGRVGMGNMTNKAPSTTLHLEETNPTLRLVDERAQASGAGNVLGTMEWYTRDASFGGVDYNEVGSIEVINVNGTATPDTRMEFAVWNNDAFGTHEQRPFAIWPNGNIAMGDGTTEPTKAKVEIFGSVNYLMPNSYGWLNNSGPTGITAPPLTAIPYSLYAESRIAASSFHAHSDARIKKIEGISDRETDLTTLMQIQITDYRLRDSIAKGNRPTKKVIAQQVAEVYPQAVSSNLIEVIPDIYQRAEVRDGWIMLSTDLKAGERVQLISENSKQVYEVIEAEPSRFKVSVPSTELRTSLSSELFVYGREVDDFHTVDYEAISMLTVSATQAQQQIIEEQQKMIEQLLLEQSAQQKEIDSLTSENLKLKQSFDARLQALESTFSRTIN